MRLAVRWIEQQRFRAAIHDDEDPEDLALHLLGADDVAARRRSDQRLSIVREAGGEVA